MYVVESWPNINVRSMWSEKQLLQKSFIFVVHVNVWFVYQHRMVVGRFTRFPARTEIRKWWYLFGARMLVHVTTNYIIMYLRFSPTHSIHGNHIPYTVCLYVSRSRTKAPKIDWINIKVLSYAFGRGGAKSVRRCHITRCLRKRDVRICALHTVHNIQTRMMCHWESGELPWHLLIADCTVSWCLFIRFGLSVDGVCACVWRVATK